MAITIYLGGSYSVFAVFLIREHASGVWGVTEQEMHLSPLPAIISTIFPRFNLNMAMPRICLATNII